MFNRTNRRTENELRQMVAQLRPGQLVWTLDETGYEIREYIFMASCPLYPDSPDSALIVSGMPCDIYTYESLVDYHLHQCSYGDETYVRVILPDYIFTDEDEAYGATIREDEDD